MTSGGFAIKKQNNSMVASFIARRGDYGCKIKPCKYSILKAKVTEVIPSHRSSVFRMAINTDLLKFEENWKKAKKSIRGCDVIKQIFLLKIFSKIQEKPMNTRLAAPGAAGAPGVVGVSPAI